MFSQIQKQLIPGAGTAFEPLLEKYIGKKVVMRMLRREKSIEYSGILKDYTTDFIEILDVEYKDKQLADIIASRQLALVRHLGK